MFALDNTISSNEEPFESYRSTISDLESVDDKELEAFFQKSEILNTSAIPQIVEDIRDTSPSNSALQALVDTKSSKFMKIDNSQALDFSSAVEKATKFVNNFQTEVKPILVIEKTSACQVSDELKEVDKQSRH